MLRVILAALWLACSAAPLHADAIDDVEAGNESFHGARYQEAIDAFTRAIESGELGEEALVIALNNRGVTFNEIGDYDQAVADYREALRLKPGDPTARKNLRVALTMRGVTRANIGDTERAMEDYAAAIEAEPESARPWLRRAQLHLQRQDREAALADLQAASARDPSDPDVRLLMADIRERLDGDAPGEAAPAAAEPAMQAEAPAPSATPEPAAGDPAAVPESAAELPEAAPEPAAEAPEVELPEAAPGAVEPAPERVVEPAVPARRADPAAAAEQPASESAPEPAMDPAPEPAPAAAEEGAAYRATGAVYLRAGPDNEAAPLGTLVAGEIVAVLGEERGWLRLRRKDGTVGYVYRRWLTPEGN
ncbi:SH3 domain-containing protein [Geminicoccaceae bacterium 1502E]|nr:SH3 domain-containing protein [Geminicoccaceae bacterium 1502E]